VRHLEIERGARQTLVFLVLRATNKITNSPLQDLAFRSPPRPRQSCIQPANSYGADLCCSVVPLCVALSRRMQAAFHWRIHKLKALRTHQPINASNEAALAKIGQFVSRILRKNVEYLELRCSLGEFQVAQIELLPSPSGLAIAGERGKCNKGVPCTEE
jgi:hypothetical protein